MKSSFALIFRAVLLVLFLTAADSTKNCALDTDHNGSFSNPCTGTGDVDGDETMDSAGDCDPANDKIYRNDISYTHSGCTGTNVRRCNKNGTGWSACAPIDPVTQIPGVLHEYVVDCVNGLDTNAGSRAFPWQHPKMFSYYCSGAPAGHHDLVPGDLVWFKNCSNMDDTFVYNTNCVPDNPPQAMIWLHDSSGTAANPIYLLPWPDDTAWKMASTLPGRELNSSNVPTGVATCVLDSGSSYLTVGGGDFDTCTMRGESTGNRDDNLEIFNNKFHDAHGEQDFNLAGLRIENGSNLNIHNNEFWDNYETGATQTQNSVCGIDLYNTCGTVLTANKVTPTAQGLCQGIRAKHSRGDSTCTLTVTGNKLRWGVSDQAQYSMDFAQYVIAQRNVIELDPGTLVSCFGFQDVGGPTNFRATGLIDHNTCIGGHGIDFKPSRNYDVAGNNNCGACATMGTLTVTNNIFIDDDTSLGGDEGILLICTYGSDDYYDHIFVQGRLQFDHNCYKKNAGVGFQIPFWAAGYGGTCSEGSAVQAFANGSTISAFITWQALGFDVNSLLVDPGLNSSGIPSTTGCTTYGAVGGTTTTTSTSSTTTAPTTTTTLPNTGAGSVGARARRDT